MDWLRIAMCVALLCTGCGDAAVSSKTGAITLRSDVTPVERVEDAMPGVFIPPFEDCRDGVCTNVAISGCTQAGRYFPDVASCAVVRTQRPFWPEPPAAEPRPDDPRLADPAFMEELAWMTQQVEASACTCCHDSQTNDGLTGQWNIRQGPIWLDTLSNSGLALFVGFADSSSLGAYPSSENHGFDRTRTGIPTTDTARMQAFLMRELERRGISEAQARAVPPFGGPIYANRVAKPDACDAHGFGVDPELGVHFGSTAARYVYVLEETSANPGVPPNLDSPEGTLWRLDVLPSAAAVASGLRYGSTPRGSFQALPERGAAPKLEQGKRYHLYALRDVGVPLANCIFTFGDAVVPPPAASTPPPAATSCELPQAGFGAECRTDADCPCSADYCALMPGQTQGVCTVTGCKEQPERCPMGWNCLDLSAFAPGLPSICTKS